MRNDVLVTPDEFFYFARIPKPDRTKNLIIYIEKAVEKWTIFRFGLNWLENIVPDKVQIAGYEVMAFVEFELYEPSKHRREILENIIKHAEWCSRTTYQTVRHFLRHKLKPLATAEKIVNMSTKIIRAAKGEFEHYEQVRAWLNSVRNFGADVAILKGNDERLSDISSDLFNNNIPCHQWDPTLPAIRYYIVDESYLFLFSHGNGIFTIFSGSDQTGLRAMYKLWNFDWDNSKKANNISSGNISIQL